MEGKTILVIEDNELNLKLCRSLFELNDFQISEAVDAEKGIEIACEKRGVSKTMSQVKKSIQ